MRLVMSCIDISLMVLILKWVGLRMSMSHLFFYFIVSKMSIFVPNMSITILRGSSHHIHKYCFWIMIRSRGFKICTTVCTTSIHWAIMATSASLGYAPTTSAPLTGTSFAASSAVSSIACTPPRIILFAFDPEPRGFHVCHHGCHNRCHSSIGLRRVGDFLGRRREFLMIVVCDNEDFLVREKRMNVVRNFLT